ncbi:hypothetical protein HYDPIDRAFT_169151 [Hydnomerulius pinastri MD-312]|uniref:NACHT domain-containing protein n=1 Tax=Hydnomerulius pinastri MD-312 TaxID=994086 RepID=A0A0C9VWG3_9AGAM|nr:hypothetical protein HYDPIDRAFT_169151 [Hydnomerulius pinastri MD-312]
MFNNASHIDASHSTFSEVHRDQHIHSQTRVQGNQTVNTIVHGNQIFYGSSGLDSLIRASVTGAAFDSIDRHPAPTCLSGTRLGLLARLTEWADNCDTDQRICWLSGLAGSGKSAVAQTIAEKYAGLGRLAASFFFSRKEIARRTAQRFFPTITCQLLASAPSIKLAVINALSEDSTIPTKVLVEQMRRLLLAPILSTKNPFSDPMLIVVDSLDECDDEKMASEVIVLLAELLRDSPWPFRVLFTSRAEPYITKTFQQPNLRSLTSTLELRDFSVDDDIKSYLRYSFDDICQRRGSSEPDSPSVWPTEEDLQAIVQKSAGLFIFATTVVKFVGDQYNIPATRLQMVLQAGTNVASSSVYSELDTLYLDALRTFPDGDKTRLVLGFIVLAFSPLSVCGLNNLLAKFQVEPSLVVDNLRSVLVSNDSAEDQAIRIYHTSFRDFLVTSHRSRKYFIDATTYHRIIAQACLESMIRHLTGDMCHLGDSSVVNSEVEDLPGLCKKHIQEGVRYACRWFAHHLAQVQRDTGVSDTLILCVQGFARGYLLNWIEVLSLVGELDSAIVSLRVVADWLKSSSNPHQETLALLRDAERLVLMFFDPIQQSALQVYNTIPLVPKLAQLRATYQHELMGKFSVPYGLDDRWNHCLRSVPTGKPIASLAVSASGRLIASAGGVPGVQMWDSLNGRNVAHFAGSGEASCPVCFSPSGNLVATGYGTGAIDVWDVSTGQSLVAGDQTSHQASVTVLVFSRNSCLVASASMDSTIRIWDVATGCLSHSLAHHEGPVHCLSFSFGDGILASGSEDKLIITSDVTSGRLLRKMKGHSSKVNSVAFSTDSNSIASGSDDLSVRVWDTRTGVCLRTYTKAHQKPVTHVYITADNKHVVSICDMNVYLWEMSSRKASQHIWSVDHFLRKCTVMFPVWYAKLAMLFTPKLVGRALESDDGTILRPVFSPDSKMLAFSYGSSLLFLDRLVPTMTEAPFFFGHLPFNAVSMAPDSSQLVTSDEKGTIQIWSTMLPKTTWKDIQDGLKSMLVSFWPSPDGRSYLIKHLFDLWLFGPDGRLIKAPDTGGDYGSVIGASASPDSRYFAYWAEYMWNVNQSFSIHVYDATTGVRLKRLSGLFKIECIVFSAGSEFLACGHGEGTIQVWELPSGQCVASIDTGHGSITSLAFVPGNVALVCGSVEGCLEMRLLDGGDILHQVECATVRVSGLAVTTSSSLVVAGYEDGSLFVWDPSLLESSSRCLSPKDASETPDGVDFVTFTGNTTVSSRSKSGIISTWDLKDCFTPNAEGGEGLSYEGPEDQSTIDTTPNTDNSFSSCDDSDPTVFESGTSEATTPNTPTTPTPCAHLLSRSDSAIVYDRYLSSTYSVHRSDGWIYRGSKRMFWLPDELRPESPNSLSAAGDRLVIFTQSTRILFLNLRPMVEAVAALR